MQRRRSRILIPISPPIALACALGAACSADGPTTLETQDGPVPDLYLSAPWITSEDLVSVGDAGPSADRPALVEDSHLYEGGDESGGSSDGGESGVEIWDAHTNVGFDYDHAYAEGSHRYSGQVGRVETTAHVTWNDAYLGTQTAVMQEYDWLTLRSTHFVTTYAQVNTDHSCGLSVQGRSLHAAWAELFQIKGAPTWGRTEQTTSAGPVRQDRCGRTASNVDPTGTYSTGGGIVCTYLITYDLATLQILDVTLLSCSTTDGDKF